MSRRTFCFAVTLIAAGLVGSTASANVFFTDQAPASTGHFEWDVFDILGEIGFAGPHPPDVAGTGVGTAKITAVAPGTDVPAPAVTTTNNLYSGARIGTYTAGVTGAATGGANSTAVMQIAAFGFINASTLKLDGAAPTQFVDRGTAPTGANYYWAQWQLAADPAFDVVFDGGHPHFSLAGVQLDYFNGASVFSAIAAPPVPEPAAMALAGVSLAGLAAVVRRRCRSLRTGAEVDRLLFEANHLDCGPEWKAGN